MARIYVVRVRLSKDEYNRLKSLSESDGCTMSEYVRETLQLCM